MKPYDKSNSFMRRVTKRVSEYLPGMTWMNTLISDAQTDDDPSSVTENDDQPPVKKLCTSVNSFTNTKYQPTNSTDNHRSSNVNVLLPEISAVTCIPSTSKQSPKFTSQSSTFQSQDVGNRSCLKRKSDVIDLSNINRPSSKTPYNFASSTPAIVTENKQSVTISSKRPLNLDKLSTSNEFSTPNFAKLKPRENESQQSSLKFHDSSANPTLSASFRWDTFVNYGELSERQKLFAQKSPLNCSQVMYGGNSARSNLSKILGNTPPIHRKAVIPISSTNNSEIRTTSSILLGHISTKNKEIEENKFIIQPKVHQRHKAEQKSVPIKVESTVKIVETTPAKADDKSNEVSSTYSGQVDSNTTRKLRVNLSKKGRNIKSEELEMPAKVDLPKISLPLTALPSIDLSNTYTEDNEFTFNQPLTIEQFSSQLVEKTCRKTHKMAMKKSQTTNIEVNSNHQSSTKTPSTNINISTSEPFIKDSKKVSIMNNDNAIENPNKNDKLSQSSKFVDAPKNSLKTPLPCSDSKLEFPKPVNKNVDSLPKKLESKSENQLAPEKSSTDLKKWSCDACWVSNDADVIKCIACQTPKSEKSQTPPLKVIKSSTWTCETCWVPNKNEIEVCVACQTQKPGTTKKTVVQNISWTCDGCWVKNKNDCTTCISCGTAKPGSAPENKPLPSTQFKFGLNNNTFENSGASQFKFGFDGKIDNTSNNKFQFGSSMPLTSSDNGKLDTSTSEFKFGIVNNKSDQPLSTFKFGTDSMPSLPEKKYNEDGTNINNTDHPKTQFRFGFESKPDQPESQFKFGLNATTNKPIAQYKFGSDKIETEKTVHQNPVVNSNVVTPTTNEFKSLVNNINKESENSLELQNKTNKRKVDDASENSTPQLSFGSVETNSNSLINVGHKNEDPSIKKFVVWDTKAKKIETKPTFNFGSTQPVQSATENTNQMVNGHSHPAETSNEDQKPALIKTSQLFSFGSLAKQDQNVPVDQKNQKTFTFGSVTNDNKPFTSSLLGTSSFSSTAPVFGASNSMFGSGPTSSTPATLGSSIATPQFSFGSLAPQIPNNFFSQTSNDNDKKPQAQTSNIFSSTNNVGFSFGAQSPPVFSVPNAGGPTKMSATDDDQTKCTSNNIFNQSSIKQTVKLDPNAPISINFTGGATTQFTAKPETTEQPPKRKILKPVRRIR